MDDQKKQPPRLPSLIHYTPGSLNAYLRDFVPAMNNITDWIAKKVERIAELEEKVELLQAEVDELKSKK